MLEKIENYNDLKFEINVHRISIKTINKCIKLLLKEEDKNKVLGECKMLQEWILNNVNDLNNLNNFYEVIPKKELKSVLKKVRVFYLGYLQLNNDIQGLIDVLEIDKNESN